MAGGKSKQNVISIVFPKGLEHQKKQIQQWAENAGGMSASKYALIVLQMHVNAGKPLKVM